MEEERVCSERPLIRRYSNPTAGYPALLASDKSFLFVPAVVMTPAYPSSGRHNRIDPQMHARMHEAKENRKKEKKSAASAMSACVSLRGFAWKSGRKPPRFYFIYLFI